MSKRQGSRFHLAYLDGLRGLSAFYVLLFHVIADGKEALSSDVSLFNFLRFGHEAVVVFVVLSGFLLSLQVVRSPQLELEGGFRGFFMRRARRILPGYYAALLLLPLFYLAIDSLKHFSGEGGNWTRTLGLIFSTDMVLHLFLLQNLSNTWTFSSNFNMVLWIVVTEWWIYFVFALVLLPIWRRLGTTVAACGSIVFGLLPPAMQLLGWPTLTGCPYLVGAFGLGMMSADVVHKYNRSLQLAVPRTVLVIVMTLSIFSFCWISVCVPAIRLSPGTRWITDYLIAIVCATFFLLTASTVIANPPAANLATVAIRILESHPMVLLGQFSYSLYLTHLVVWAMLGITLNLAPVKQLVLFSLNPMEFRISVLIPAQIVFAYGFYLLFEKPFLRYRN